MHTSTCQIKLRSRVIDVSYNNYSNATKFTNLFWLVHKKGGVIDGLM